MDDPIFIPISTLEQRNGKPVKFNSVAKAMIDGETGHLRIEDAIRSIPKGDFQDGVMLVTLPSTYYYTSIKDSEYVFAFNLADSDENYRRPASPPRGSKIPVNYYANIESYNSSQVKQVRKERRIEKKLRRWVMCRGEGGVNIFIAIIFARQNKTSLQDIPCNQV